MTYSPEKRENDSFKAYREMMPSQEEIDAETRRRFPKRTNLSDIMIYNHDDEYKDTVCKHCVFVKMPFGNPNDKKWCFRHFKKPPFCEFAIEGEAVIIGGNHA